MVYIYKKNLNGKFYYYLRISKRVKGKVIVKDIAYLGENLSEIQMKLDNLNSYKSEIRKSYRNIKKFIESEYYVKKVRDKKLKNDPYIDKQLLEEIEAIKMHFNDKFLKLDNLTKQDVYKAFLIDFAFNTTSIEGNTITLKEAEKLINENLTPKNRTLREIYDLQNTEKVFLNILESKENIEHDFIINIHDELLNNIDERKGYRNHEIRVFRASFKASHPRYVKADMAILLQWYKENKKLHPFVLAGVFHHKFEKIHPFSDGNGRTGRMLMNYMLLKSNFPPFFVKKSNRSEYLSCLDKGNKANLNESNPSYYKDLINYLASEMVNSYWNNFLI